jgi:putative ABC transport system permease protein
LEAPRRRDWTHFGTCIAEGEFGEFAATLYRKLHALVRRRDLDRELDEELQFHLSMRAEQYRHEGGAGSSAETAARRRFGNLGRVQEQCRDQWTFVWLETMWQDLRYGVRQLRRSPGFTVSATVTLMLGIGATTAVYSMLHTVLWRPVPLPDLGSLVFIMQASPGEGMPFRPTSPADLDDIRSRVTTVRDLAAWQITRSNIVDSGGEPMVVESARVSPNLFSMLGIRPALGRVFRPEEDQRGKEQVVLLSDSLWRRHFGGDANIVGRTVRIEGRDFTVVGVMPPEFRFPRSWRDMWIPLALTPDEQASRNGSRLEVGARLQPGRSRAQVTAELDGIAAALEKQYPETNRNRRFLALSFERYWYGDLAPIFASLILGGSLFVLLIACANVANLQFARATTRVRELAVRTALGSGLWRQVRQLLTESVGLAALGGALGLVVAWVELGLLKAAVPAEMRHYMAWDEIGINARALAFALAATVASGILAGLAPAWRCRRIDLVESLKEGGHGSSAGPKGTRWRSILAAGEIAAATVLLVGSVLMVHGFRGLVSASSSAEPASMLTMQLALDATRYREPHQVSAFYRELVARAAAIPGVRTAAAASGLPYSRRYPSGQFAIQGRQFEPGQKPSALIEAVTPDYFRALLVPLRTGRLPTDADRPGTTPVAVISQRAADRWWPGRQPIGDQIRLGERDWVTIVGVVGDLSYSVLNREPGPVVYVPFAQMPDRSMNVGLRVAGDPMRVAPAVRSLVRSLDPELPVTNLSTLDVLIRQESYGLEFMASFMGVSGLLALILSVVGLYGVTAYSTSARTHETGIRMALGARRRQVIMRLFGRGMVSVISGLGLGLIPAWGLARLMQSVVWGVRADDPAAFVGVPAVLIGVAALAVLVPALRATRIDPVKALRHD